MNPRLRGSLEMIAAMTISGTIGWFALRSRRTPVEIVFWRCFFGLPALFAVCAVQRRLARGVAPRVWLIAGLGGVAIVLNWLLLFASYSRASIGIATAVYCTQPFMLVALGALFFKERLTLAKFAWLALAFAGVVLIVAATGEKLPGGDAYLLGVALALAAAFCYAVSAIFTKRLSGVAPQWIALVHVSVGVVMLAPFVVFHDAPPWSSLGVLATMGLVHTGLMFTLLYGAFQRLPTHLIGSLTFIYPLVAIVIDYFAFDRRLGLAQAAGAAAIVVATAGMNLAGAWPKLAAAKTQTVANRPD